MQQAVQPREFFAAREGSRLSFVSSHIKGDFALQPLAQDWASRRYFRISASGKTYVLMEAVPDHVPTATMGHKLSDFLRIASWLHSHGIHTPEVIAAEEDEGYVLLEDMGDTTVNDGLERGENPYALYSAATDVLINFRDRLGASNHLGLPRYKDSYIRKGRQRIVDWYIPATRLEKNDDSLLAGYLQAWDEVVAKLPPPPLGFIHGDFHPGNLMLLKDGTCGVLDFQDAMWGPISYDLVNLLENIRRDVPIDIYEAMLKKYGGDDNFHAWFRVMGTQFHCRIIGQVLRLAIVSGKDELMQYMPRIQRYLIKALQNPVLAPLARWMKEEKVDLAVSSFDPARIKAHIRADAF